MIDKILLPQDFMKLRMYTKDNTWVVQSLGPVQRYRSLKGSKFSAEDLQEKKMKWNNDWTTKFLFTK